MPIFLCQTRRGPFLGQGTRMPFSEETLSPVGPRKQGQSTPVLRVRRSGGSAAPGRAGTEKSSALPGAGASVFSVRAAAPQPRPSTHSPNASTRIFDVLRGNSGVALTVTHRRRRDHDRSVANLNAL